MQPLQRGSKYVKGKNMSDQEGKSVEEENEKDELWGMDQTPESRMRIADLIRMARREPEMIEPIGSELSEQQDDQQRLTDS